MVGQGAIPGEVMDITAIIPTYNRASLVRETVTAVLAQTRKPDEVIVVNDGSDDGTADVLKAFGGAIRVLDKPNSGKADSLNKALRTAGGSHIWIVDDDDLPRAGGLKALAALLERHTEAEMAYGRHERFSTDPATGGRRAMDTGYWDNRPSEWFLIATLEDFFAHQPAMLVSRALYERAGPFNPGMHASEDYEMLVRLAHAGVAVGTGEVIFDQRIHGGDRGQNGFRYGAASRDRKWAEYDRLFFSAILGDFPLSAFLPRGMALTAETGRQALLQRGTIRMRHGLREAGVADYREAAGLRPGVPLSGAERDVLRRAMTGKYGCEDLPDDEGALAALQALRREGGLAGDIARASTRALVWQIRTALRFGRRALALRLLGCYLQIRFAPAGP